MKKLLWLPFFLVLLFSCSKEDLKTESVRPDENPSEIPLSLESAKTWYNHENRDFVQNRNSDEDVFYITPLNTKQIWEHGKITTFNGNQEIIVVPIEQAFKDSLNLKNNEDANLFIFKDVNDNFTVKLMLYVTDSVYNESNAEWNVSNYSGAIVQVEEDGYFSKSIIVYDGKIRGIISNPSILVENDSTDNGNTGQARCDPCYDFAKKNKFWRGFGDLIDDIVSGFANGVNAIWDWLFGGITGGNPSGPIIIDYGDDFPNDFGLTETNRTTGVTIYDNDDGGGGGGGGGTTPSFGDFFNNDIFTRDNLNDLIFDCFLNSGSADPNDMPLIVLMEDFGSNWAESFYLGYLFYFDDPNITTLADGLTYAKENCSTNFNTHSQSCNDLISKYGKYDQNVAKKEAMFRVFHQMMDDYNMSGGSCADMDYNADDALNDFEQFLQNAECKNAAQTFLSNNELGLDMSVEELINIIGNPPNCGDQVSFNSFAEDGIMNTALSGDPTLISKVKAALNDCEKAVLDKYPDCSGSLALNFLATRRYVKQFMGTGSGVHNCKDAFRHAFFNALNTYSCGSQIAEEFSDAHECNTSSSIATEMDTHNNDIGRQIAQNNPVLGKIIEGTKLPLLISLSVLYAAMKVLGLEICEQMSNGLFKVFHDPTVRGEEEMTGTYLIDSDNCECGG